MKRRIESLVAFNGLVLLALLVGCSTGHELASPSEGKANATETISSASNAVRAGNDVQDPGTQDISASRAAAGKSKFNADAKKKGQTVSNAEQAELAQVQPTTPPSFADVVELLDLRSELDDLQDAIGVERKLSKIYYTASGTMDQAIKFYTAQLVERGWQIDETLAVANTFRMEFFRKHGFLLMLHIDSNGSGGVSVSVTNFGNIKCTALPHPKGANLKDGEMNSASFVVDGTMEESAVDEDREFNEADATLSFLRVELSKQGWTEFKENHSSQSIGGPRKLLFMQGAAQLTVNLRKGWSGKSTVEYMGRLHDRGLTVVGNATEVTLDDAFGLLKYDTDASTTEVIKHHRESLALLGWQPMSGGESSSDIGAQLVLNDSSSDCYNVIALPRSKGGTEVVVSKIDKSDARKLIHSLRTLGAGDAVSSTQLLAASKPRSAGSPHSASETLGKRQSLPETEAVRRIGQSQQMKRFFADHGTNRKVRIHQGDLHLDGDLVLDFSDQMHEGEIQLDPVWRDHQGLVVTGDLTVEGSVMNANGDYGKFLFVGGNLNAKNLIGGGADILVVGDADIRELVLGHYNDGTLEVIGETRAKLVVSDDHASEIITSAPVWNSQQDVVSMPMSEYLHRDIQVERSPYDGDQTGFLFIDEFDARDLIQQIRSGKSALRQPEDTRPRTSQAEWRSILRVNGAALQHVPTIFLDTKMYLSAVSDDGRALQYVPNHMRTAEICREAVEQNGYALKFVPKEMQTADLHMMAVCDEGYFLEYVPVRARTREICIAAVLNNEEALRYVPLELRKSIMQETHGD